MEMLSSMQLLSGQGMAEGRMSLPVFLYLTVKDRCTYICYTLVGLLGSRDVESSISLIDAFFRCAFSKMKNERTG